MTSKLTRERLQEIAEDGFLKHSESKELARMALAAMDQKPALHRYRRKAVEPYGPYPWHYEVFVDYPRSVECIEDEYFYAAPPVVTGFAVDGEPAENHIGSKNALDAIVSFIKSKSNPTVKCYEEVSEQLFKDNCHGIHSHVIEYILKLGEELEDFRAEQAGMPPAQPVADSEPVIVVGDDGGDALSYRRLIQSFEPGTKLYRHAQQPVVPEKATVGEMPFLGTSEGAYVRGWNDCRAAMLQENAKSAGVSNNCRSSENVQVMQDHQIRELVNQLRDIAVKYHAAGQLREQIARVIRAAMLQAGNSPVIPDGSASMLRRWLAFGRGMQNAGSQLPHNLIAETESMLAAAPQEAINALIPLVSRNEQEVK
ncbi:TPA: hypothetical protein QIZ47_002051 [Klebsiella pneumoniae subsp. pneumoniae]|nr:hypothetical protein [Klebsiella pneumoniae subsp. pneumoniae]